MKNLKLLKIEELVFEEEFYPRMQVDWMTVHRYAEAMKIGNEFPPITVCHWKGKWFVIDGWHRAQAYKRIGIEMVQAEVLNLKTKKDIYLEAVKRNAYHGRPFSMQERVKIIARLEELKVEKATIENLVGIPINKWKRVKSRVLTTPSGKKVFLKAPVAPKARELSENGVVPENIAKAIEDSQEHLSVRTQIHLLDQFIDLLESRMLDLGNKEVLEKLEKVYELVAEILHPKVVAQVRR